MKHTLIISGGHINLEFAGNYMKQNEFNRVIAVDGGLLAADRLGVVPDCIVGDFDTVSPLLLYKYEQMDNVTIKRYRPEKDYSDTYIAMKAAIEEESLSVHIIGALGGRFDHSLANVQLLQYALNHGIESILVSEKNRIRLLGDKRQNIILEKRNSPYKYVSLLPFTDKVSGVTTMGMKYNINNHDFYINKEISLGISNEILDEVAEIRIAGGQLLLVESND